MILLIVAVSITTTPRTQGPTALGFPILLDLDQRYSSTGERPLIPYNLNPSLGWQSFLKKFNKSSDNPAFVYAAGACSSLLTCLLEQNLTNVPVALNATLSSLTIM